MRKFILRIFVLLISFFSLSAWSLEFLAEVPPQKSFQTFSKGSTVSGFNVEEEFTAFGKNFVVLKSPAIRTFESAQIDLTNLGFKNFELNAVYELQAGPRRPAPPPDLSDFSPEPVFPNDKDFTFLWGLLNYGQNVSGVGTRHMDSGVAQAWNYATGSHDVVVGVMDTGIEHTHEDLRDNLWTETVDGKTVYGWDALNEIDDVVDQNKHGTHVAGTIGARGNNGVGVAGVNWAVRIASVKIFNGAGSTNAAAILRGLSWFYDRRDEIRVINHSWGGRSPSAFIEMGFRLLDDEGVINVIAAGNNGEKMSLEGPENRGRFYPAMYELNNSIVVAAHNNRGQRASFSNYSEEWVHLAAPGVDIHSTTLRGFYESLSGTSMAAPHVAGAVALLMSARPELTTSQVRERVIEAGLPTPTLEGVSRGSKRLNVLRLFQ